MLGQQQYTRLFCGGQELSNNWWRVVSPDCSVSRTKKEFAAVLYEWLDRTLFSTLYFYFK